MISFHLFVTFNFLYQCLILGVYKSFTSVVKFILRYFIIFDTITCFFLKFSDSLLLPWSDSLQLLFRCIHCVYFKFTEFIYANYLVKSLGFSLHVIMSSASGDSLLPLEIRSKFLFLFFRCD